MTAAVEHLSAPQVVAKLISLAIREEINAACREHTQRYRSAHVQRGGWPASRRPADWARLVTNWLPNVIGRRAAAKVHMYQLTGRRIIRPTNGLPSLPYTHCVFILYSSALGRNLAVVFAPGLSNCASWLRNNATLDRPDYHAGIKYISSCQAAAFRLTMAIDAFTASQQGLYSQASRRERTQLSFGVPCSRV